MVGYTPCFRREAGSYGAHVRGLNRVHQFDKVEIVRIEKPENSYAVLEEMVEHVKGLLRALELPFRQLLLCGGDMGFSSAMTYDMEVYAAAQERWLEVSSISNFETFQSNRLKLRVDGDDKKNRLAHTLEWKRIGLGAHRGGFVGEQPDPGRHPHSQSPATLHGVRHDPEMNRGIRSHCWERWSVGTSCRRPPRPTSIGTVDGPHHHRCASRNPHPQRTRPRPVTSRRTPYSPPHAPCSCNVSRTPWIRPLPNCWGTNS